MCTKPVANTTPVANTVPKKKIVSAQERVCRQKDEQSLRITAVDNKLPAAKPFQQALTQGFSSCQKRYAGSDQAGEQDCK